jgi:hypothetical protein
MRSAALNNIIAFVNGVNTNLKFVTQASTALRTFGASISGKAALTLAEATTAGLIDSGEHWVCYLGLDSTSRTPTPLSPKRAYTATGAKQLRINGVATFSDVQINHKHIYMTTAGAGSGGDFYLARSLTNDTNTACYISISDAELSGKEVLDITSDEAGGFPPKFKHLIAKWNRFYGVPADYPSRVRYSLQLGQTDASYNESEMFPGTNALRVNEDDGDYITAWAAFRDSIIVFKRNAIYEITQTSAGDPNNPSNQFHAVRQIPSNGVGCVSESSQHGCEVSSIEGGTYIYFPWYDGIWRLGENDSLTKISDEIQETWDNEVNAARFKSIEIGVDPTNRYLLVSVSAYGKTINNLVLRYDLIRKKWMKDEISAACFAKVEESNGQARLYFGDNFGFLNRIYDTNYDGIGSGTLTGNVTADGDSGDTSFTVSGGLYTGGQGLRGCPVVLLDEATGQRQRFYVKSNSATVIYLYSGGSYGAVSGTTFDGTRFYIGGISFRVKLAKHVHGVPDRLKEFYYANLYIERKSTGTLDCSRFIDGAQTSGRDYRVRIDQTELQKVPLYPDELSAPTNNTGYSLELLLSNFGVNEPLKIRAIGIDANVTNETKP